MLHQDYFLGPVTVLNIMYLLLLMFLGNVNDDTAF